MTTATTSALAAPTAMIFSFNEPFVHRALSGLTEDELRRAPSDRNNNLLWVAGHIVQNKSDGPQVPRRSRGHRVGKAVRPPRRARRRRPVPDRRSIGRMMRDVSPRLNAKLTSLTDDVLTRPATMQVPVRGRSRMNSHSLRSTTRTMSASCRTSANHWDIRGLQVKWKTAQAERVLDALGDPTRRLVFKRLRKGTRSVRELADGMDVSRPAVSQHLRVLHNAGLIVPRIEGARRR